MSTTSEPSVAVVGATGAVGNEIVELIAARGFPHSRLTLFASQSGAAGTLETEQDEYLVEALHDRGHEIVDENQGHAWREIRKHERQWPSTVRIINGGYSSSIAVFNWRRYLRSSARYVRWWT